MGLFDWIGGPFRGSTPAKKPAAPAVIKPRYQYYRHDLTTVEGVKRYQNVLIRHGFLDKADGNLGTITRWAREEFKAYHKISDSQVDEWLDKELPLPFAPANDFAGWMAVATQGVGFFMRHPGCYNIIYVEDTDMDGARNNLGFNKFGDARCIVKCDANGRPVLCGSWEATTEPGAKFTDTPLQQRGAFHIDADKTQWAWQLGTHHTHEAWIQTGGSVSGTRDYTRKGGRDFGHPDQGWFGINQHWGYDFPRSDIRNSSAGCLVGRKVDGHLDFMRQTKQDARVRARPAYVMPTTVLSRQTIENIKMGSQWRYK